MLSERISAIFVILSYLEEWYIRKLENSEENLKTDWKVCTSSFLYLNPTVFQNWKIQGLETLFKDSKWILWSSLGLLVYFSPDACQDYTGLHDRYILKDHRVLWIMVFLKNTTIKIFRRAFENNAKFLYISIFIGICMFKRSYIITESL